ncbi:MAG TPA: TIGR01212 family radical SAM protein [Spirochaetia bacterium]|nr:TIGR01212 family radical SAM protein [Spirochaetia bacterium]
MSEPPYLTYSRYLRQRHGCTVYRVAVDAGFCCPNRRGGRDASGCSYCSENGSRAPYLPSGLRADVCGLDAAGSCFDREGLNHQIRSAISFLSKRYSAEAFILFFQAYSNTNAPAERLAEVYDAGLAAASFRGISVATRPDCLDEDKARLLSSYLDRGLEVWVELGLQSACDRTLRRVGRGHTAEDFRRAHLLLKKRGIKVGVHLIFGLPGETFDDMMKTIAFVARLSPDGVKIHNLLVHRGSPLAREMLMGEVTAPAAARHLEYTLAAIERLPPETVIMRITCDALPPDIAAPRSFWSKGEFTSRLQSEMRARGARQGRLFPSLDLAIPIG